MMNNERFEKLAKQFDNDTGLMAPGKDAPPQLYPCSMGHREHRTEMWNLWLKHRTTLDKLTAERDDLAANLSRAQQRITAWEVSYTELEAKHDGHAHREALVENGKLIKERDNWRAEYETSCVKRDEIAQQTWEKILSEVVAIEDHIKSLDDAGGLSTYGNGRLQAIRQIKHIIIAQCPAMGEQGNSDDDK